MKCLECNWNDNKAPESGKCCGECGLCPLCEMSTRYTQQVTLRGKGNQRKKCQTCGSEDCEELMGGC